MKNQLAKVLATLVLTLAVAAFAAPHASAEDLYRDSAEVDSMLGKLGRGASNLLLGWLEVPKQIGIAVQETDPFSGTFIGICKGLGWGFARTAAGAFEVVTFPFPVPKGYEPMIEPEFIMSDMWGEPMPIFADPDNNVDNVGLH